MLDDEGGLRPFASLLAGSRHFAKPEPISDIGRDGDLYLTLARTIEREVIPRLLLNTRAEAAKGDAVRRSAADIQICRDVTAFCQILLKGQLEDAEAYVTAKLAAGASLRTTLLDLFAPTARRLGEMWESDACSFLEVTLGLGRLQHLLRLFSEAYRSEPEPKKLGFLALLATVPTNQHVFGIYVVEELFRHAGWNVLSLPSPTPDELLDAVGRDWFAVVGLSICCDDSAASVATLIQKIRARSLNRSILVLVGGRYVIDNPARALAFGADLVGPDVEDAIQRSQALLGSIGRVGAALV